MHSWPKELLLLFPGPKRGFPARILWISLFLFFSSTAFSQSVTMSLSNVPLEKAFSSISRQTGYRFIYTRVDMQLSHPVTLEVTQQPLDTVLQLLFADQPLTYVIDTRHIVIRRREERGKEQNGKELRGLIIGEGGKPLAGASVEVRGTRKGAYSNEHGQFQISHVWPGSEIVFSSIGYESRILKWNGEGEIQIQMVLLSRNLDEAIVIAYGETTRRRSTGNVSQISEKEIQRQPVSNPLAAMQGRVPGVQIIQGSGMPGSAFSVLIRGQNSLQNGNSPLFVIDGVPFLPDDKILAQRSGINANSPFNTINPQDIESISVLKDADATAIYGSRGANGVVIITTKKGSVGKSEMDASFYNGWGKVGRSMDYLNTREYVAMRLEALENDGKSVNSSTAPDLIKWDTSRYTNWKKFLIGGTAHIQNAQLSFRGSSELMGLALSINQYHETTVFPSDLGNNRTSINLSIAPYDKSKKLSSSIIVNFTKNISNLSAGDVTQYINLPPNAPPVYDTLGNLNWSEGGYNFVNPLSLLLAPYKGITNRLSASANIDYRILKNLKFKISSGYNHIGFDETLVSPISIQNPSYSPTGAISLGTNTIESWIVEPHLELRNQLFGQISTVILAGASWQMQEQKSRLVDGYGYTDDELIYSLSAAGALYASNGESIYKYNAFFSRINFSWRSRLIVNLSGRRDGSSRFGPGKRFSNFGAIGAAYIFGDEKYIKQNFRWISSGKIRGSFGTVGNDQIGDYQYLDALGSTPYPYDGLPGLRPLRLYNPDYSWERTTKVELGLDLGILKNRILFSVSFYRSRSDNQIVRYSLAGQSGNNSVLRNLPGIVENKGVEVLINSINLESAKFSWETAFTFSSNSNQLISFPGLELSSYANTYQIGKPVNARIGFVYSGVNSNTGVYEFGDQNHDGQLNKEDYVYLGTTDPKYYSSITNRIQIGSVSLEFMFQYVRQQGLHAIFLSSSAGGRRNQPVEILDHWQMPGQMTTYQQYSQNSSGEALRAAARTPLSGAVLTDASYTRLKTANISWRLPTHWMKRFKLRSLEVFAEGQNLLTITNYVGHDPENQQSTTLPPLKVIAIGAKLQL